MTSFYLKFSRYASQKTAVCSSLDGFWCKTNLVVRNFTLYQEKPFQQKFNLIPWCHDAIVFVCFDGGIL